jgi:hypothetical protein
VALVGFGVPAAPAIRVAKMLARFQIAALRTGDDIDLARDRGMRRAALALALSRGGGLLFFEQGRSGGGVRARRSFRTSILPLPSFGLRARALVLAVAALSVVSSIAIVPVLLVTDRIVGQESQYALSDSVFKAMPICVRILNGTS